VAGGSGDVEAEELPQAEEENEEDHPQPDPDPHAAAPRVEGRKEPQGGAHAREAQRPLLAPDEDHGQDELPDEPNGEAQQQGLDERRLDRE
jgi:hypothetical protein